MCPNDVEDLLRKTAKSYVVHTAFGDRTEYRDKRGNLIGTSTDYSDTSGEKTEYRSVEGDLLGTSQKVDSFFDKHEEYRNTEGELKASSRDYDDIGGNYREYRDDDDSIIGSSRHVNSTFQDYNDFNNQEYKGSKELKKHSSYDSHKSHNKQNHTSSSSYNNGFTREELANLSDEDRRALGSNLSARGSSFPCNESKSLLSTLGSILCTGFAAVIIGIMFLWQSIFYLIGFCIAGAIVAIVSVIVLCIFGVSYHTSKIIGISIGVIAAGFVIYAVITDGKN